MNTLVILGMMGRCPFGGQTSFGYDPSHSIVKARQEGLRSVLYKPFRVDQLLDALESSDTPPPPPPTSPEPVRVFEARAGGRER